MKKKSGKFTLLLIAVLVLASEASAIGSYVGPLSTLYGNGSCATCHIDPNGGGARNPYGKLFEEQPNYMINPTAALTAIGAPGTSKPVQTAIETPSTTPLPSSTPDLTPVDTPSNSEKEKMPSYVSDVIDRLNHAISILMAWKGNDISDDSIASDDSSTASKDDAIRIDDDHTESQHDEESDGSHEDDDS